MRNRMTSVAALAAVFTPVLVSSALAGPIVYDFQDGDPFDFVAGATPLAGGVGATSSKTDGTTSVALTTVDVQAPQYSATTPFAATGVMLDAAGRTGFTQADVRTQTLTTINSSQMGINNPSISDTNGTTAGIGGNESGNINVNEAWVFKFDTTVTFTQMNLVSVDAVDTITVTVGNLGTFTIQDPSSPNDSADDFNDPFNGLQIPANTEITFKNTTNAATTPNSIVRIDSFTVTPVAAPEPATLGAAAIGLLTVARRRRV